MGDLIRSALDRVMGRRSVLGKLATAAAALFAGVLGLSISTQALVYVQCCDLYCNPTYPNPCDGGDCPPGGVDCGNNGAQWCWSCCSEISNWYTYWCIENFQTGHYGNCNYGGSAYAGPFEYCGTGGGS